MNSYRHTIVSAALAALQALILTWMAVVIVTVFIYTVNASSPMMVDVRWQDAARIGSRLWALALGGPFSFQGVTISLAPLAVTWVIWRTYAHFLGRRRIGTWWQVGIGAVVAALAVFTAEAIGSFATVEIRGPVIAAALFFACGLSQWWRTDSPDIRGVRDIATAWSVVRPLVSAVVIAGVVLVGAAVFIHWPKVVEIHGYYVLETVPSVILTGVQLLFLPNLMMWGVAYATGAGFAVGTGTAFSSLGVESAPLPALPIFGALPAPGSTAPWMIGAVVVLGLVVGLFRGHRFLLLTSCLRTGVLGALWIAILAAIAGFLSSGALGPGRMTDVGVAPAVCAGLFALELGGGFLLGLLLRNPQLHERIRALRSAKEGSAGIEAEESGSEPIDESAQSPQSPTSAHSAEDAAHTAGDSGGDSGSEDTHNIAGAQEKQPAVKAPSPLDSYKQRFAARPIAPPAPAPTAATASLASSDYIPTAATAFSPPHIEDEDPA